MKTQAWGWLMAGVLAAGLNASYHDGGLEWAHRIVERVEGQSAAVLALASGRADEFLTQARLLTVRADNPTCPLSTAMAQVQTRVAQVQAQIAQEQVTHSQAGFVRFQAMSARQEAQLARLEASRVRMEAELQGQLARVRVHQAAFDSAAFTSVEVPPVCPRVRVNIPRMPNLKIPTPVIHIETPGAGPV